MTTNASSLLASRRALVAGCAGAAVALFVAGAAVAASARARRAALEAEVDGVALRVRRAVWLDHRGGEAAPGAHPGHLPGMAGVGFHRLAVSFVVENQTGDERRFKWQSLALRWPRRMVSAASHDGRAHLVLPPGHRALLEAWFDVPETEDTLTLSWEHGTSPAPLLTTRTPVHGLGVPGRAGAWPELASALPRGRAREGARLFLEKCASCHGDPAVPGSSVAGPHLGGIGAVAGTRVTGTPAAQYVYESMLDPDAYHARTCEGTEGCAEPAPMPSYGESLSLQEAADLVAYLLAQGSPP